MADGGKIIMTRATVHVVGAGLSGLACAVALAARTCRYAPDDRPRIALYDMAGQAGGRCRSFYDETIGAVIDNGNHLVFSGNRHLFRYLDRIGARDQWFVFDRARFPFYDLKGRQRWSIDMGKSRLPLWIFGRAHIPPGLRRRDFYPLLRLALGWAGAGNVGGVCPDSALAFARLWEPLTLAVLNTPPSEASAALLGAMLRRSFLRGGAFSRPCLARHSLSSALVDPAVDYLRACRARVAFSSRVRAMDCRARRAQGIVTADGNTIVDEKSYVVLAVPPSACGKLLDGVTGPRDHAPILNIHFRLPPVGKNGDAPAMNAPINAPTKDRDGRQKNTGANRGSPGVRSDLRSDLRSGLSPDLNMTGMIGGIGHWLFTRGALASVTVSAADRWIGRDGPWLAGKVWREVAAVNNLARDPLPPYRIIREKRATFRQTANSIGLRPDAVTRLDNVFLAGDWTDTGLPATLEGAIASGHRAADLVMHRLARPSGAGRMAKESATGI